MLKCSPPQRRISSCAAANFSISPQLICQGLSGYEPVLQRCSIVQVAESLHVHTEHHERWRSAQAHALITGRADGTGHCVCRSLTLAAGIVASFHAETNRGLIEQVACASRCWHRSDVGLNASAIIQALNTKKVENCQQHSLTALVIRAVMVTEQPLPARIAASHALSAGSGELSPYR